MSQQDPRSHGDTPNPGCADLRIAALDRAMAGFAETTPISFHLSLDFDAALDLPTLERAWQFLGAKIPALRACADLLVSRDHWTLDPGLVPVEVVDEDETDGDAPTCGRVEAATLIDGRRLSEPGVCRLTVIRRGRLHRVVWTGHHAVMDGSSTVEVVAALAELYRDLRAGRVANLDVDTRSRCLEELLADRALGAATTALVAARYAGKWARPTPSDHPLPRSQSNSPGYAGVDITDALRTLSLERRRRGWRTSAVLIALVARAWNRVFDDGASRTGTSAWQVASNLRSELGLPGGLGNMSGTEPITLTNVEHRPLHDVVDEANRLIRGAASGWPGLGAALSALQAAKLPAGALTTATSAALKRVDALGYGRSFSNVGAWPARTMNWADVGLRRAFYAPAFTEPQWCTVVAYDIGGRAWISMRTHALGISAADVAAIGRTMLDDARSAADNKSANGGSE